MSQARSSEIRITTSPTNTPPNSADEARRRFARAAITLDAVTHRQKREVETYRETIGELRDSMNELRNSLKLFRRQMDAIRIDRLGRRARSLARIMDGHVT